MKEIRLLQPLLILTSFSQLGKECQRSSDRLARVVSRNLYKNREIQKAGNQLIDNGIKKTRLVHIMSVNTKSANINNYKLNLNAASTASLFNSCITPRESTQ